MQVSITNSISSATESVAHHKSNPNFMAFIRNRLNVIGTSMYLLENAPDKDQSSRKKYIEKIKLELEIIRKSINKQVDQ